MGGFFGAVSKRDCVLDIFFGVDYHSHLGTKRAGMIIFDEKDGFQRQILAMRIPLSVPSLIRIWQNFMVTAVSAVLVTAIPSL